MNQDDNLKALLGDGASKALIDAIQKQYVYFAPTALDASHAEPASRLKQVAIIAFEYGYGLPGKFLNYSNLSFQTFRNSGMHVVFALPLSVICGIGDLIDGVAKALWFCSIRRQLTFVPKANVIAELRGD